MDLLKILVLNAGKPVHRDTLIDLLWPESKLDTGANKLHGVVHALRQVIEPDLKKRKWIYIRNENDFYFFETNSNCLVDLFRFKEIVTIVRRAKSGGAQKDLVMPYLEEAASLYRGDLFHDSPHEAWLENHRSHLRQEYFNIVHELALTKIVLGKAEAALDPLRAALDLDPFREETHQLMIKALSQLGRRHEAKEQYNNCLKIVREELNVEPLPETLRLRTLFAS